jgi:D-alanyl-D-alanine carboxypeptidase
VRRLLVLALSCWICVTAATQAEARYASIVVEAESGRVLHAVNADTLNFPASLTKMMTLYLAFEALDGGKLDLGRKLRVSRVAAGRSPSKLGLRRGQTITVRDIIGTLVTKSANDAATVMAEALAGSERAFGRVMTRKAAELGMSKTTFRNASGLPHWRQRSTARDMATLARALLRDFPHHYHFFSLKSYSYAGRSFKNHNRLLSKYAGADGLKTGYIRSSGYNLAASAERDGRRLVTVVFGGKSPRWRDRHVTRLMNRGFAALKSGRLPEVARRMGVWPPVPKPKPDPHIARGWSIQVGAFNRFATAHLAVTRAARVVPDLLRIPVSIKGERGKSGKLYHARLVGMSRDKAHRSCTTLMRKNISCVVVRDGESGGESGIAQGSR